VGYPQVNGIILFKGKRLETNYPRLKFVKKRYEDTFKYFQKNEEIKQEIITQKLKGILIRPCQE
jgi:hypothetical protein